MNSGRPTTIHDLNDDCLIMIFEKLSLKSRLRVERVSKHWSELGKLAWRSKKKFSTKSLSLVSRKEKKQLPILQQILTRAGKYLRTISIDEDIFDKNYVQICHMVAKNCSKITDLRIRDSRGDPDDIFDRVVAPIFRKNKRLEKIQFHCLGITGKCFLDLGNTLEEIVVNGRFFINPQYFQHLFRNSPRLKRLDFEVDTLDEEVFQSLGSCRYLKKLKIGVATVNLPTGPLDKVGKFENLTNFDFHGCDWSMDSIDDSFVKVLSYHCPALVDIKLQYYDATANGLKDLSRLQNLKNFHLVGTHNSQYSGVLNPSRFFKVEGGHENMSFMQSQGFFEKLTKIDITRQLFMCDEFLELLSFCSSLKHLILCNPDFSGVTPTGGLHLCCLQGLESLELRDIQLEMPDSILQNFSKCQKISNIWLDGYYITNEEINFLSDLPHLEKLHLEDISEELTCEAFVNFSGLNYLTIKYSKNIDKKDLEALPGMSSTKISVSR